MAFYFKEKNMSKKDLKTDQKTTKTKSAPITKLDPTGKSKETSKIKSSETANAENHYVNGSYPHAASNRGK